MQGQINSNKKKMSEVQKQFKQILRHLETQEFIDEQFPHVYENIYDSSIPLEQIEQVIWMPCQELHHKPYYSKDFTLKEIHQMKFISRSMNDAFVLMKMYCPKKFKELIKQRDLIYEEQNRIYKHVQVYEVFLQKELKKVWMDSFVPVSEVLNKEVFCQTLSGCVFPCLIEKLMAKLCKGYQNIIQLKVYDIMELFTGYLLQKVRMNQLINSNEGEQKEKMTKVQKLLIKVMQKEKGIVFFRTRKNSRLQQFGLRSNHAYFIVKLFKIKSQQPQEQCISFLELPESIISSESKRQQWIGKLSKYRTESQLMQLHQVEDKDLRQYENFMFLKDMVSVTKELIILHNTSDSSLCFDTLQVTRYKNLDRSYSGRYQEQNNLIEENVRSQIVQLNEEFHESMIQRVGSQVKKQGKMYKKYKQTQSVSQMDERVIKNWMVQECWQISLQKGNNRLQQIKQGLLMNMRIFYKQLQQQSSKISHNYASLKLKIQRCTIVIVTSVGILKTMNIQIIRIKRWKDLRYYDVWVSIQRQQMQKHKDCMRLEVMVMMDVRSGGERVMRSGEVKVRMTVGKRNGKGNGGSHTLKLNHLQYSQSFHQIFLNIFNQLIIFPQSSQSTMSIHPHNIHNNNPNNNNNPQIQIICKQFIQSLNIGVICFRFNTLGGSNGGNTHVNAMGNMNNPNNQSSKSNHHKPPTHATIQVDINSQIMLLNHVYLIDKIGHLNQQPYTSRSSSNDKSDNTTISSYRFNLTPTHPYFYFLFRISTPNHQLQLQHITQSYSQPKTFLQFPPLNSLKISRIFTAHF